MKRFLAVLAFAAVMPFMAMADDYVIPFEQLPEVSRSFVQTHFSGVQVAYAMRDSHSYEVRLADGGEIEFDYAGNWKEVDCKYRAVPASVMKLVPEGIPAYVSASFPKSLITKVNVKNWGYELELDNGLDLEFNKTGAFLRIDD